MKDPADTYTKDIFDMTSADQYHWQLKNCHELTKQPDGSFKMSYTVDNKKQPVTAATIKECVMKAVNV